MKTILLALSLMLFACKSDNDKLPVKIDDSQVQIDQDSTITNPVFVVNPCLSVDSLTDLVTQLRADKDSLKTELFLSELRIEKVKYYTGIVERNPSQIKFLKGWIKRAVQ